MCFFFLFLSLSLSVSLAVWFSRNRERDQITTDRSRPRGVFGAREWFGLKRTRLVHDDDRADGRRRYYTGTTVSPVYTCVRVSFTCIYYVPRDVVHIPPWVPWSSADRVNPVSRRSRCYALYTCTTTHDNTLCIIIYYRPDKLLLELRLRRALYTRNIRTYAAATSADKDD